MSTESPRGPRLRLFAVGAAALAVISLSVGTMLSLALFTDDVDVDNNTFTTGTVVLSATPATALFNVGVMMPGDNDYGQLTVANAGTAGFRYSMTTSTTNPDTKDLGNQLEVEVRLKAAGTCAADFTGTVVVPNTTLDGASFGDATQGQDTGDRLLPSGNEVFCFRVSLPFGTGNGYQGATTDATFTFHAEQTAHN